MQVNQKTISMKSLKVLFLSFFAFVLFSKGLIAAYPVSKTVKSIDSQRIKEFPLSSQLVCDYSPLENDQQNIQVEGNSEAIGWGIASLTSAILGIVLLMFGLFYAPLLYGLLAVVFGGIGMNKKLKGLSIAGVILGVLEVTVSFLVLILIAAFTSSS